MLPKQQRWQGCAVFLLLASLLLCNCNASGVLIPSSASENSPSELARIVQLSNKQAKRARICGADPELLSSLAGSGAEVMLTIPNDQLEHMAEFQEEADLWVVANVARFHPATRITHVVAGDDAPAKSPATAHLLVPAMLNLRSALAAAGLAGRVTVSSALSAESLADPAWSGVVARVLRFLRSSGAPLFLLSGPEEETDAKAGAAHAAMRAMGVSGVPVVAADLAAAAGAGADYYYYSYYPAGPGRQGKRRSLAAGMFCVALQNADPAALQAGLNWACGPGQADCSAIQPGGPCYKQNDLPALASYAYNDYYQSQATTGATCSFNGTATTTTTDPSSGSCVFTGSSMGGGSNSSVPPPVGASPPTSVSPPTGFTPPVGSSPPSSDFGPPAVGTTPPSGFTPPGGGGFGPPAGGFGSPPGFGPYNGSFGPSGSLNPYGSGSRGAAPRAGWTALSAVAAAVLLVSTPWM